MSLLFFWSYMEKMNFFAHPEWSSDGVDLNNRICIKQKNRWKFIIPCISANGVSSLPPAKVSRPTLSFKEITAEHLNETIYFPSKPDFKPISLTLYDIRKPTENPVFSWIKRVYNPAECAYWRPPLGGGTVTPDLPSLKCAQAFLVYFDGCGNIIDRWVFEHIWPQQAEFAEGDMSDSNIVYCDVTLRFDRAYICLNETSLPDFGTLPSNLNCSVTSGFAMADYSPVPEPEFITIRNFQN